MKSYSDVTPGACIVYAIKQPIHSKLAHYSADGDTIQHFTIAGSCSYGRTREIFTGIIRARGVYRVNRKKYEDDNDDWFVE